jgi:1-acyl-sn-glycerol-3-phosphate acyltransferase
MFGTWRQGLLQTLRLVLRGTRLLLWLLIGALLAGYVGLRQPWLAQPLALRQRVLRFWLGGLVRCLPLRVQVFGQLPTEPALWVSNHVSWCDIPLLGALQPLYFVAKAEVRQWPLAGWLAQQVGTLFIRRGAGDSGALNQQIGAYLRQQRPLLIFPEGTTTDGRGVRTFHGRLLSGVLEHQIALQPVAIRYRRAGQRDEVTPFIGEDDLLRHLLRLLRSPTAAVELHLLPLLHARPAENRNQLARRAQHCIAMQVGTDHSEPELQPEPLSA